jgi:hypothetical protein
MTRALALFALTSLSLSTSALAGGTEPGSLLIFPEFDNRSGQTTYLTITNTSSDPVTGLIDVHLNYVDASNCQISNRIEHLTPRDTTTFMTIAHVPSVQRGYMWCYVQDPIQHRAIDMDVLVGASLRLDAFAMLHYSIQPLTFQGLTGAGNPTDVNNNGQRDLNGIEYEKAPNKFFVPRFFGQGPDPLPRGAFSSELILFQPLVSSGVTTNASLLVWNDNEEVYSAQYSFQCWTRVRLTSISGSFAQSFLQFTNQNPNEVVGYPAIDAGWFEVRGATATNSSGQSTANPPIFGVLVECKPNSAADLPYIEKL